MQNSIGNRLEEIRKEHKLSRKGLEEISGFKARTIESYEKGQNQPSREYIEFISLYFGYTEDYIKGLIADELIEDIIIYNKETFDISNDDINISDILSNENNHFYFTDINVTLDETVRILKMYQSIYNYNNIKMAEILEISPNDYENTIKNNYSFFDFYEPLELALKLNIKPISFGSFLIRLAVLNTEDKEHYEKLKDKCETIEIKQFLTNPLYVNPSYYASIIKQRNSPEIVTPNTQKELIPDKYKEILELLPFAPDSFTQNLKDKLLEMKKAQKLEDL